MWNPPLPNIGDFIQYSTDITTFGWQVEKFGSSCIADLKPGQLKHHTIHCISVNHDI